MSTFYPPNIWYCNIFQHLIIRPQKDGKVKIRPKWWWFILFYHFGCYYKSIISHIPRQRGLRLPRSPRCLLRPGGSRRRVVKGRRRSGEGLCVAPALRRKWRGGFNGGRFISWKKTWKPWMIYFGYGHEYGNLHVVFQCGNMWENSGNMWSLIWKIKISLACGVRGSIVSDSQMILLMQLDG